MPSTLRIGVRSQVDVERARRAARAVAAAAGFRGIEREEIVLAVSELAANLARYARNGEITMHPIEHPPRRGIAVESRDTGPGIADMAHALRDGASTGSGLGGGLPGVRRLMDEMEIESAPGGTTIVARKWISP